MKKITFSFLTMWLALSLSATTWTVTNSGFTFSPDTLIIEFGDTVVFDLENIHTVLEVSEATWNANGTTPLAGGFSLPLGGGTLFPADLPQGTHHYVCEPHASTGMKGVIIVEGPSAIGDNQVSNTSGVSIYPNPTRGSIRLVLNDNWPTDHFDVEVYNLQGIRVFARSDLNAQVVTDIDLSKYGNGLYLVKVYTDARGDIIAPEAEVYEMKVVVQ